jgi:hypothetical protein
MYRDIGQGLPAHRKSAALFCADTRRCGAMLLRNLPRTAGLLHRNPDDIQPRSTHAAG